MPFFLPEKIIVLGIFFQLSFYNGLGGQFNDHSVIPAAVKTPGNKFAGIIMSGINMVAVKTPDKKFA